MSIIMGLAPMDGFTDCTMRDITQQIFDKYEKGTLYLWTEFMTADGYCAKPEAVIHHLKTSPNQKHLIAQIHGGKLDTLLKTVQNINKKYAKDFIGIELNLGCPARNIMKSGGGSELLKDKKNALEIVKALSKASKLPFSIKTRTGLNDADKQAQFDFLVEASKYCDMITVHGRTMNKVYSGEADWNFIYELKKKIQEIRNKDHVPGSKAQVHECKIIGNGGIHSYDDIEKLKGNLDGVMIGQAAIGNPRIFTSHKPSIEEKKYTVLHHLKLMVKYTSDQPQKKIISEFRKHLFQYVKGIPGSKEFKQKVSTITEYEPLVEAIQEFFE